MSIDPEKAVSYAALILADEAVAVTSDRLQTLLKAASVEIDPIWSTIFSKALKDKDLKQILTSIQTTKPTGISPHHGEEKAPELGSQVNRAIVDDGDGSESGSDIGLGLFDV
ncbi:hypothetical protein N0V93_010077 [Gnomoniopsis smithogilvyi]|uniref:Large ribosomal subunit protein P1 n=1 Tax=Gnomoniopsis smithogilvyi TaxID=1191159 RepID=A0A9W8YI81_9PEZI|nr:hypothetical protein N0V93_010077 [Gnomoniopsis smithogilvyi]